MEYAQSPTKMELKLSPGESRDYWKYRTPNKWFRQAKAGGKINSEKTDLLFDSEAEVSIIDTIFARNISCAIDEIQKQEYVGIVENSYLAKAHTKGKIKDGSIVHYLDVWFGDQVG